MCQNNCTHTCTEREREKKTNRWIDGQTDTEEAEGRKGERGGRGTRRCTTYVLEFSFAKYPVTHVVFRVHNPNF